jgi:hypothetical protein
MCLEVGARPGMITVPGAGMAVQEQGLTAEMQSFRRPARMSVLEKDGERSRFLQASLEILVGGSAILLLMGALAADQAWFDRHFLPNFAVQRSTMVMAERALRSFVILAAASLLLVCRRPIARMLSRATVGATLRVALAIALALAANEVILRVRPLHPHDADPLELEPRRQSDPLLGWKFLPSRSIVAQEAGRPVSYSFDAAGYRVPTPGAEVDVSQPTLVFTGESIIVGFGLAWEETIPARVGSALGIQSADLAVSDYSNDQSYLRLAADLPRFKKPVAVVTLFMPSLFDRNLLDNRPRLAAGSIWLAPERHWRLAALLDWLFPYRSTARIDDGVARTRKSLGALVHLACAREAQPLIVVPQFGDASPVEEALKVRILDDAGLPYVKVRVDPSWHLPGDAHPDARAARAVAAAIIARLRLNDKGSPSGRVDPMCNFKT